MKAILSSVTTKGQVVIPHKIRKKLNIRPQQKLSFQIDEKEGFIKVMPVEDILDMAGSFKTTKKYSAEEIRQKFEKEYERI